MKPTTPFLMSLLLPALLACGGCSRSPRARFADRIAGADTILLARVSATNGPTIISVGQREAGEIANAVRSATSGPGDTAPSFYEAARIEFRKGTNALGTIIAYEEGFWLDQESYKDETGVVRGMYKKIK